MSVKAIITNIDSNNNNAQKVKVKQAYAQPQAQSINSVPTTSVTFTGAGFNPIVSLMDFIEAGGYAASFIIQDGIGFIAPRVGKGLLRGGEEKKDENGNVILNKKGEPERELNWDFARKEALREVITGPSAFLIPMGMLAVINKYCGTGNSVKLNYLDGFQKPFTEFVKENLDDFLTGKASKEGFYNNVFEEIITRGVNGHVPDAEKIPADEIKKLAASFTDKQLKYEAIQADKS